MESLTAAMAAAEAHSGGIDVVIAAAGIGFPGSMETVEPDEFDRFIDTNLNGVWRAFRAALPQVKARRGYMLAVSSMAAFIHSSMAAFIHSPLQGHYIASKAGVWALCNSVRLELGRTTWGWARSTPPFSRPR